MSRKKPAPDLIRGGNRFSDKDMRNGLYRSARPQMKTWKPSRLFVTMYNRIDYTINAVAVAIAAPAGPNSGIRMTQSTTFMVKAPA